MGHSRSNGHEGNRLATAGNSPEGDVSGEPLITAGAVNIALKWRKYSDRTKKPLKNTHGRILTVGNGGLRKEPNSFVPRNARPSR